MIAFIKGKVDSYGADYVVVDCHDTGWYISYPHPERLHLNAEVKIYTYLHYTDMDISLYGFESQEEKDLFMRLISVKGLGPKTAMNMLARADSSKIIEAVETGNVTVLKSMPGIGAKTASQIVLDLKGKLVHYETKTAANAKQYSDEINDTIDALKNLGYKPGELNSVANYLSENPGLKTEEYLKMALKYLMKAKLGG
ncbi:MAG: Holliday junction branch migration protein RuvA [Solobacterium sp.]|nr:Holliday junction branch migration protein RuvA [Solobacterium sp.]